MSVHADDGTWIVPPHRAVWIPRGVAHRVEMAGRVALRMLFFRAGIARDLPRSCRAVNVSPLLRELILHATRLGLLQRTVASEARLARVILDQLHALPQVPLQLPSPRDERARRASELLTDRRDADEPPAVADVVRHSGASKRTLERLFRKETHMTLGRWRQRERFVRALRLLAEGHAITQVALEVGYANPSAFVSAFRRQMGTTPGRYFAVPPDPIRGTRHPHPR